MKHLTPKQIAFIEAQPMFFVGTAAAEGRVNISPKGLDTLRVLSPTKIVWLSLSGSGNESAAHVARTSRMTLMFMSIAEAPLILRAYGTATVTHPRDEQWDELSAMFPEYGGRRQIFDVEIDLVQVSCGTGVPIMTVESNRGDTELHPFYGDMTEDELVGYWAKKNVHSIDGYPTHIFDAETT